MRMIDIAGKYVNNIARPNNAVNQNKVYLYEVITKFKSGRIVLKGYSVVGLTFTGQEM